jgi:hypothetical protein
MTQQLMERVVNRIAAGLRGRSSTRRSFLSSVAVVGSAIATHPIVYASRPISAYAAACGDGASCDLGWSAFCCTVIGANQCPPGSFAGGWWKADQSSFCCGTARYYVDCNATCGSAWRCHCEGTETCDKRRVACNQFRYGQCNQQISCYGPVVCRVITCTPPWELIPECTSTSRTDNRTATHTAPCLPGSCPSLITQYYYDHGGPGGEYGPVVVAERAGASGSRYAEFANAVMYTIGTTVQVVVGGFLTRYKSVGGPGGPLGYPVSGPTQSGSTTKMVFQRGLIYGSSTTAAHSIYGPFYPKWNELHGLDSGLGLPITEQQSVGTSAYELYFQTGVMCTSPTTGTHQVTGVLAAKYASLKGPRGVLGLPITDQSANSLRTVARFQHGTICSNSTVGTFAVLDPIDTTWWANGQAAGSFGLPTADAATVTGQGQWQRFQSGAIFHLTSGAVTDVRGSYFAKWTQLGGVNAGLGFPLRARETVAGGAQQVFAHGALYALSTTGIHMVNGAIYTAYTKLGGSAGTLGFPTSDPYAWNGKTRVDFQHGSLVYDPSTGTVTRL